MYLYMYFYIYIQGHTGEGTRLVRRTEHVSKHRNAVEVGVPPCTRRRPDHAYGGGAGVKVKGAVCA